MLRLVALCSSLAVLFWLTPKAHAASKTDYYQLYDSLFSAANYKKEVLPAENETSVLYVYLVFHLLSLVKVDEKQQTLVSSARLELSWDDDYLSWDSGSHANIETILVPQKNIYLPDIVVANTVLAQSRLGYDELQARINVDGIIEWQPTALISTSCDIDITYFPFDTQKCFIKFETAVSTSTEIKVLLDTFEAPINLEDFTENGQWEVISTSAENLSEEDSKTKLQYGILLKRRRTFYVLNIIMPVFFLSLTASLVFALPADEGEKMGTGITVLLAFAVYLTIVSDLVPNTSLQVSILAMYLTILLGLSAVSIITCVFILRLHFREANRPVGRKTTALALFLRKVMFLDSHEEGRANKIEPYHESDISSETMEKKPRRGNGEEPHPIVVTMEEPRSPVMTWQKVAHALDMLCFILFTLFTIIVTLACMLSLHIGGTTNGPTLTSGRQYF